MSSTRLLVLDGRVKFPLIPTTFGELIALSSNPEEGWDARRR